MAAAAAAAAQVSATLKVLGAKQYATAYNETPALKDSSFDGLDRALFRAGFAANWADWVINPA